MKRLRKKISGFFLYIFVLTLRRILLILPLKVAVGLAAFLGYIGFYIDRKSARVALENITRAYPGMASCDVRKLARAAYINQGKNFAEFVSFPKYVRKNLVEKYVDFVGSENLAAAYSRGKGTIIVTAHFGNWELLGASIVKKGYPVSVIARKFYVDAINDLITRNRELAGLNVILRATEYSARDILKALKSNHFIGILIDQDTDVAGDFVDFFGARAYTPIGPAAIALKTGCSVVYAFIERLNGGLGHRAVIEGPVELVKTGDEKKDILENTRIFTARIEDWVRRHPEQWVWYHKRWNRKPPE